LFDKYIIGLLADAEVSSTQSDASVEALKFAADALDIRLSEIEEEVGGLKDALAKRLEITKESSLSAERLKSQVLGLETEANASESRMLKIEQEVAGLQDARKDA
jgi:chromosome segregation ATPase